MRPVIDARDQHDASERPGLLSETGRSGRLGGPAGALDTTPACPRVFVPSTPLTAGRPESRGWCGRRGPAWRVRRVGTARSRGILRRRRVPASVRGGCRSRAGRRRGRLSVHRGRGSGGRGDPARSCVSAYAGMRTPSARGCRRGASIPPRPGLQTPTPGQGKGPAGPRYVRPGAGKGGSSSGALPQRPFGWRLIVSHRRAPSGARVQDHVGELLGHLMQLGLARRLHRERQRPRAVQQ